MLSSRSSSNSSSSSSNSSNNNNNKAWLRFQHLRWAQPHSLSGLLSISTGIALTANTLRGNLAAFQQSNENQQQQQQQHFPALVFLYCTATVLNAVFGYRLAPTAGWQHAAFMFRVTALVQIFLCYFILRFLPLPLWKNITMQMQMQQVHDNNNSINHTHSLLFLFVSAADVIAATALVWTIFKCRNATQGRAPWLDRGISIAMLPLLLVATYPIQFAAGSLQMAWKHSSLTAQQQQPQPSGDDNNDNTDNVDYWSCILHRYPSQGVAMSAFIYVPTTLVFSVMIFGATLYLRQILTAWQFGMGVMSSALLTLTVTVLQQEVYLPYVSTQRIYLPCIEPEPGTWEAAIVQALDFSLVARSVLVQLGVDLLPPPSPQHYQ